MSRDSLMWGVAGMSRKRFQETNSRGLWKAELYPGCVAVTSVQPSKAEDSPIAPKKDEWPFSGVGTPAGCGCVVLYDRGGIHA